MRMKTPISKYEYDRQYAKDKMQQVKLTLNKSTDGDLLAWLEKQPNKQGYIKALIRKDILEHETGENVSHTVSQNGTEQT